MRPRPRVYLETTIISYLASKPSPVLIAAAHQKLTRLWWEERRTRFELHASQLVLEESGRGDAAAAARRLAYLRRLNLLEATREAEDLAARLLSARAFPPAAIADAGHVAVAASHGMDFLLTWNCTHINNAEVKGVIQSVCAVRGFRCPVICTPEELMGDPL